MSAVHARLCMWCANVSRCRRVCSYGRYVQRYTVCMCTRYASTDMQSVRMYAFERHYESSPTNVKSLSSVWPIHSVPKSKAKRLPPILFSRPIITFKCARTCLSRDLFFVPVLCGNEYRFAYTLQIHELLVLLSVYGFNCALFGLHYTAKDTTRIDELISHGQ